MLLAPRKSNKRQMKLLRGSERDLKLDIVSAQAITSGSLNGEDDCYPKTPGYQIECTQPFMSLMCRTFPCNKITKCVEKSALVRDIIVKTDDENDEDDSLTEEHSRSRMNFYLTLKALIRMGSGEKHVKRGVSYSNFIYFLNGKEFGIKHCTSLKFT